ncbi:xanthine dehydrogenase/oxidase-like, partial [Equus quagga]|uniref:xanthine dehydrogenase/oxidase-like n=1 Tax=Equus quagga TaxID=89248 RepID=UPI001EE37EAA
MASVLRSDGKNAAGCPGDKGPPATSGFRFFPGIEMKFKNKLFPLIVCPAWIPEMNSVEHGEEGISFGASCPLSCVEKTLLDAVAQLPTYKTEVFRGVLEQLRWFSGKQLKSVAVSLCSGARN